MSPLYHYGLINNLVRKVNYFVKITNNLNKQIE